MKTIDFINKSYSNTNNVPLKLVERVNRFYWKQGIKHKLAKLQIESLYIRYIGTISLSNFKLRNHIASIIARIRNTKISSKFKEHTKIIYVEKLMGELKKLCEWRNVLSTKYYNNELNRRISKANTEVHKEPEADS